MKALQEKIEREPPRSPAKIRAYVTSSNVACPVRPRITDVLPEEVDAVMNDNLDSLKVLVIPLYHKHVIGEEIKEMILLFEL